jgi:hypothetical protein
MAMVLKQRSILPGFGLAMGFTLLYLSLIVLIPLSAAFLKTAPLGWERFWIIVTEPRVLASYRLTFGASLIGATTNAFFGLLVAWVLVRYSFPGKRIIDALVDLPFALPTAVAGIALTTVYSSRGWLGGSLEIEVPEHRGTDDAPALAYVRLHDIQLDRVRDGAVIEAVVRDIRAVGSLVRLELDRVDGDEIIEAELTRERYDELELREGEHVFVRPRNLRVFLKHD